MSKVRQLKGGRARTGNYSPQLHLEERSPRQMLARQPDASERKPLR